MQREKYLLLLDLDETLIHARKDKLDREPDFAVGDYFIYKRPGVDVFLRRVSEWFDVAVWSSSGDEYLSEVIQLLFHDPGVLKFVWSERRCTQRHNLETDERHFRKNLCKVKRRGYPLEHIIAVDDSPEKYDKHYGNLVRVRPYEGDLNDDELPLLLAYLDKLREVENVRRIEKRGWRKTLR